MSSKQYFEKVADRWDVMRTDFFSEDVRIKAYAAANVQPGGLAADIGAGTGFVTEGLVLKGLNVIAVDQSEAMLQELKGKFEGIDCRVGEADRLPVQDETVDYAFANMYLHHTPDPRRAIKEMARILKPGGAVVITDLDKHDYAFLKEEHHDRWMGFKREDVAAWFRDAGLKDAKIECVGRDCCANSRDGCGSARISIFAASGVK